MGLLATILSSVLLSRKIHRYCDRLVLVLPFQNHQEQSLVEEGSPISHTILSNKAKEATNDLKQ